jgi:hypothetical protein
MNSPPITTLIIPSVLKLAGKGHGDSSSSSSGRPTDTSKDDLARNIAESMGLGGASPKRRSTSAYPSEKQFNDKRRHDAERLRRDAERRYSREKPFRVSPHGKNKGPWEGYENRLKHRKAFKKVFGDPGRPVSPGPTTIIFLGRRYRAIE